MKFVGKIAICAVLVGAAHEPSLAAGVLGICGSQFYPPAAVAAHIEGANIVLVTIGADGSVKGVQINKSSGNTDLDNASLTCVKTGWHFKPATQDGVPVESQKLYQITWKLTGQPTSGQNVAPPASTP